MGIETSADHGGAESSFTSAIIVIEELAKIDPSVSVLCDVHNTLVNTIFRKYGTKEQQDKWLPQLAESKVRLALNVLLGLNSCSAWVFLFVRGCIRIRRIRSPNSREKGWGLVDTQRLKDVDHQFV